MLLTKLRPYQIEARDKALPHPGFCLFNEQRTGKTPIALALIDIRKPKNLLIVCPKNVIVEWKKAFLEHLEVDWEMDVEFINYESLMKRRQEYYRRGAKGEWNDNSFIICDESHRIKRRGSKASRAIRKLARRFTWRLALSGTPISPKKVTRGKRSFITEGYQDLWAQFDFINPKIFGKYTNYKRDSSGGFKTVGGFEAKFCIKGGFKGKTIIAYKNVPLLKKLRDKYSYRITFDEANKGKLKYTKVKKLFSLDPKTQSIYDQMVKDLKAKVHGRLITVPIMLALTMKLQQLTGGYLIHTDEETERTEVIKVGDSKLTILRKLLLTKKLPKDPWIIVARFKHEHEAITGLVRKLGMKIIAISGKSRYDPSKVKKADIILLQIASGSGIDLSAASTTVYYSWDYSYINQEQSRFRMVSYGKEQVNAYYLIAKGTVDGMLYDVMTKKKDLTRAVCDHFGVKSGG